LAIGFGLVQYLLVFDEELNAFWPMALGNVRIAISSVLLLIGVNLSGAYILVHINFYVLLGQTNSEYYIIGQGVLWCVFSSVLLGIGFSLCYAIERSYVCSGLK
jgi:hypothetical protein